MFMLGMVKNERVWERGDWSKWWGNSKTKRLCLAECWPAQWGLWVTFHSRWQLSSQSRIELTGSNEVMIDYEEAVFELTNKFILRWNALWNTELKNKGVIWSKDSFVVNENKTFGERPMQKPLYLLYFSGKRSILNKSEASHLNMG